MSKIPDINILIRRHKDFQIHRVHPLVEIFPTPEVGCIEFQPILRVRDKVSQLLARNPTDEFNSWTCESDSDSFQIPPLGSTFQYKSDTS